MAIIESKELVFDYITRDEEAKVTDVNRAIDGVSLKIEEGSFVAILGHNGSGKSTFAKTLNGILLPSGGAVFISGMNTADDAKLLDIRREVGMVFQNPDNQIIANLVEDDVGFGPENLGVPTEDIWKRVDAALEAVGMTAYRLKSPNHLSGGQKQRVAIAGVMAMHPKCIVLDEPTAMLDPNGRKEVIRTITELNRSEGVTVVLITHYREVFSHVEELKRLRLDVPQATELAHELRQCGVSLPESVLSMEELAEAILPLWKEN